jgi:hypothetical protein
MTYCVLAACIGAFVGAVVGVGVAGLLLPPEEAVVFYSGVGYGGPFGALTGLIIGIVAMLRGSRLKRNKLIGGGQELE